MEYPALEREMRKLLGARYDDPAANEELFWTSQYQELIRLHLKPHFDAAGDITAIANAAAATARASTVFDQPIAGHGYEAYAQYIVGMPAWTDEHPSIAAREAAHWAHHPPRLFLTDNQSFMIEDGNHRLSVLRSEIQ